MEAPRRTSRKAIVGKGGIRADEDVVADRDAIPQLNSALDGAPIADHDVVFDKTVVADIAVSPDLRSRQYMRERPNTGPGAYILALYQGLAVLEIAHS